MAPPNLSSTAREMLSAAAQHGQRLAFPPERLPIAARRMVVQSMLKSGLLEEIAGLDGQPIWRMSEAGKQLALRATSAGLAAVAKPAAVEVLEGRDKQCLSNESHAPISDVTVEPIPTASPPRSNLRVAATVLLAAWDATANRPSWLAPHFDELRAAIARPSRMVNPRQPRPDTKRATILAILRRSEGATVAQVVDATGWARHTVHGFFAGLKKTGTRVEILERVRQVGPGKQGAAGSYTVYRVAEAG